MKNKLFHIILFLAVCIISLHAQNPSAKKSILSGEDYDFLKSMTRDVVDSSRIRPGQMIAGTFGPNNTGGILIRPGGRDCYPSFWIRDYAMSLECGFISPAEQKHMLLLTASTQCDQPWITKGGSLVPYGAIADHIRIDDALPVYFPGTLDYNDQGNKIFGMVPPYDDQFYFIHMAWYYVTTTGDTAVIRQRVKNIPLLSRLEIAFCVPPSRPEDHIVSTTDEFRGVDFGFRDVITMTGDLCMTSLLKYRAACELSELAEMAGQMERAAKYSEIAGKLKKAIPEIFTDERGMLRASTGRSSQPDVWSTGFAVWLKVLDEKHQDKACRFLADAYRKGYLSSAGNIRHVLTIDDFSDSTAWEYSLAEKDTYQNGAFWGTPTGWICYAISAADYSLAQKLAGEYVSDLRKNDFRKGAAAAAPYECFHPSGFRQNPVYMTTVTCPFIVFSVMIK